MSSVLAPGAIRLRADDDAERPGDPSVDPDARIVSPRATDRRVHRRLSAREVTWLHEARMKYGPAVRVIDVSRGGALFETQARVCPNADVELHLVGRDLDTVVPSRVLRSHVFALGNGPLYRSACAFLRSIDITVLPAPAPQRKDAPTVDYLKAEYALKSIVDQYQCQTGTNDVPSGGGTGMLDALRILQRSAERRADPGDRKLAELIARALRALEGAESIDPATASIEAHLRQVMPLVAIRVMQAPAAPAAGVESIYFDIAANRPTSPGVLNVEFATGFAPDSQQFRLLKACAYLITLLRGVHLASSGSSPGLRGATELVRDVQSPVPVPAPAAAATSSAAPDPRTSDPLLHGWQPVVVRFVDGRLLRGYTKDFHSSRPQLHLSPSPSATDEHLLVPLAAAKAVFFVKDLMGDPARVDGATFEGASNGRRIEVTFSDGEVLLGSTMNYNPSRLGFFLHPANAAGNNIRIFVISAAVRHARFLPQQL